MTILLIGGAIALAAQPHKATAQPCPEIPQIRYESDSVVEHEAGCELWPFQFARLDHAESGYLRFGGEVRQRYEHTNNPNFGQDPDDPHGVWLQRFGLFGDLRLSDRWRLFAELHSALENGRAAGPSPTDENELDFQNAFVEARVWSASNTDVLLRAGRQELDWGSSRLVSVRDGPNVRRTFDGVRVLAHLGEWTLNAVAMRPREDEQGVFDDSTDGGRALWGAYSTRTWGEDRGIDLYYLGYENEEPTYDQGSAPERRHTFGFRYFGSSGPWDWDIEPMIQSGSYGDGDLRAWAIASETGYTWRQARWRPRLMLSANIASGDRDPLDPDLETFSPLYPRGNYFSEDATLWPQNFVNAHLFLTLNPSSSWALTVDYDAFWRMSDDDAVYGPNGSVLRADSGSDERFVATALSINSEWSIDRRWAFTAIYTHVSPRQFLEQTGPASAIEFLELTARFRF
jgi:hypothetical protein